MMAARRAVLSFDLIAAAGLILLLVVGFTLAVRQFVWARDYTDAQRLLRLTAEAELNRLRAGLPAEEQPDSRQTLDQRPDAVFLETSQAPGTGVWSECTRVTVVARRQIRGGRWVRVEVSAFLPAEGGRP
jgi:hypothetical protein